MKRPFFSITIATYNRAHDLDFAIQRILSQTFNDFELIISDDNSPDETQKVIKKYQDKRIRYIRNKKNLGAVPNIGKVLSYATGHYVFLHGDDDYLLYDDVLERAHNLITKNHYGLIRFNYLYQSFDKKDIFDFFRYKSKSNNITIASHQNTKKVLEYIEKIDLYFISGIVFKNPYPTAIHITDSELIPWFRVCFQSIENDGAYYDSQYSVVASWSHQAIHPVYFVRNGRLTFEAYYDEIRDLADEKHYKNALFKQLEVSVSNLPTIKYNSNNSNLVLYAKRVLELNSSYKFSLKFWILFVVALLSPKFLLKIVRRIYIKHVAKQGKVEGYEEIKKRVHEVRGYL